MELNLYKIRLIGESLVTESQKYEWNNILDRLMINLYNNEIGALEKAKEECREKRIDPVVVDRIDALLKGEKNKKYKSVKLSGKNMPDERTRKMYIFLKIRHPKISPNEIAKCVLRYASLGQGGQQWALNRTTMAEIYKHGIKVEAFASPFNNYFSRYHSIFTADAPFGSLGSFFDATIEDGIYANPPFTPAILERMTTKLCDIVTQNPNFKAVIITPTWIDAPWYMRLQQCGFKPRLKKNEIYTTLGEEFTPRFTTTMWIRGVEL